MRGASLQPPAYTHNNLQGIVNTDLWRKGYEQFPPGHHLGLGGGVWIIDSALSADAMCFGIAAELAASNCYSSEQ